MKINLVQVVQVDAKVLKIYAKKDHFECVIEDQAGNGIYNQESGPSPNFLGTDYSGEYFCLEIHLETGQILNWKTPTPEQLTEWVSSGGEG